MKYAIRIHLHIDEILLDDVDLVHHHELTRHLTEKTRELLRENHLDPAGFAANNQVEIPSIHASPLRCRGSLRPGALGIHIAEHVVRAILPPSGPAPGNDGLFPADKGEKR